MSESGSPEEQGRSLAAPAIFFIVMAFQLGSNYLHDLKKRASKSVKEFELRGEIKQLLREASSLSQPSTFAQAAKLRRLAAAKEKELTSSPSTSLLTSVNHPDQEVHSKEVNLSYDSYMKFAFIAKVVTYFLLVCWFWRTPVAAISQQLVQPFGKLLSWRSGGHLNNSVAVGIMPWLILCVRVSRFVCRFVK